MNHYLLLQVPPLASQEDIAKNYRKVAVDLHPDKGGDTGVFADFTLAYAVLRYPRSRKKYDDSLKMLSKWKVCGGCKGEGKVTKHVPALGMVTTKPCTKCAGHGV